MFMGYLHEDTKDLELLKVFVHFNFSCFVLLLSKDISIYR